MAALDMFLLAVVAAVAAWLFIMPPRVTRSRTSLAVPFRRTAGQAQSAFDLRAIEAQSRRNGESLIGMVTDLAFAAGLPGVGVGEGELGVEFGAAVAS